MATHQDIYTDRTRHASQDIVTEFESFHSEATRETTIAGPWTREEIELQKPLLVALARENRSPGAQADAGAVDAVFDEALCNVTELALHHAGVPPERVELHKLRALMLHLARGLDSYNELSTYIAAYSADEREAFGLHTAYEQSTYRKAAKQLKDADLFDRLREACFIAVHAVFWNGVVIPEQVMHRYELSYDAGPAATEFVDGARDLALYNLVEDVLEIVLAHLDLHRDRTRSRELRSLLGVFAYAAHHDESIESYSQTAKHTHDLDTAFSGSTLRAHIDDLAMWEVEQMFDRINQALVEYAIEAGVVSTPVLTAYDLTDVQSLGLDEYEGIFRTHDGRWRFASLSFTDPALDFSFGLRLLKSEAQRARILKNFLLDLTGLVDVKLVMADRGFDGREDIEACQAVVPGRWAILAQDYSETRGRTDAYARLRHQLPPGGTAVVPNAGYDDLHPPVKLVGYSGAASDAESPDPVRAFYTDMQLPADDAARAEAITNLNFRYDERGKIESLFRMVKNRFDVFSDTDNPVRKAFYFNISVVFYNLYNLVNSVPSPHAGVELETTQNEFLEVVEHLCLGGPREPAALAFHRDRY